MGPCLLRMLVGGAAGIVVGISVGCGSSKLLELLGYSLFGNIREGAGVAVMIALVTIGAAGLVCGALGGALRRPWWGGAGAAALAGLTVVGLAIGMFIDQHLERERMRTRLRQNEDFQAQFREMHGDADLDRAIENKVADIIGRRSSGFSPLGVAAWMLPCVGAGMVGGWLGQLLYRSTKRMQES